MDSLFFYLSKIFWNIFSPDNIIVYAVCLSAILAWLERYHMLLKAAITFSGISVLFIAIFPVGDWLIFPLENRFESSDSLPKHVDGIIVLSGGVNARSTMLLGQVQVNEQADRDLAFMRLARIYPNARLVYSGGSSSLTHQEYKGADAAKKLFYELGMDVESIEFERHSRNTYESALLAKKMVDPKPGDKWLLVTSAYHIPRSVGIFCNVGWPVIPYPVDYKTGGESLLFSGISFSGNLQEFMLGLREWVGLLAYRVSGKISSVMPDDCN